MSERERERRGSKSKRERERCERRAWSSKEEIKNRLGGEGTNERGKKGDKKEK